MSKKKKEHNTVNKLQITRKNLKLKILNHSQKPFFRHIKKGK